MFEEWKKQLNNDERDLLNAIFSHWKKIGEWPKSLQLYVEYRKKLNLYELAEQLGYRILNCGQPEQKDGVSILSVYGIALCDDSEEYQEYILKVYRCICDEFIKNPLKEGISSLEIKEGIEKNEGIVLDIKILNKVFDLISDSRILIGSSGLVDKEEWSFRAYSDIVKVENIKTIEELYKQREGDNLPLKFGGKPRDIGYAQTSDHEYLPYIPNIDFIKDRNIKSMVEGDLGELDRIINAQAWKQATICAGSIAETLLYYLLKQNEEVAIRNLKKDWPYNVNLYGMVKLCYNHALISKPDEAMFNVLRIVRNQVHPANAIQSQRPDEFITESLRQFVFKIIKNMNEQSEKNGHTKE